MGLEGGGGWGRDSKEDIHREVKFDVVDTREDGAKKDCVRWTSGVDIRMGEGGREGERSCSGLCSLLVPQTDSDRLDLRTGWRDIRSRCSSSNGSKSDRDASLFMVVSCDELPSTGSMM